MFKRINNILTFDQDILAQELRQPYVNWGTVLVIWFLCVFGVIMLNLFFVPSDERLTNNPAVLFVVLSTAYVAVLYTINATAHAFGSERKLLKYAYAAEIVSVVTISVNFLDRLLAPLPVLGLIVSLLLLCYRFYLLIIGITHIQNIYQLSTLKAIVVLVASAVAGIAVFSVWYLIITFVG